MGARSGHLVHGACPHDHPAGSFRWSVPLSVCAAIALHGGEAGAQVAAPSAVAVAPESLVPAQRDKGFTVDIPEAAALSAPAGAEAMAVTLGDVTVEGGFPEVAAQTDVVVAQLKGNRISLAHIYWAASEIEAIHARAGYILARVSVPPQDLSDGGRLKLVITDGFVEQINVDGLPQRIRAAVLAHAGALVGRRHVKVGDLETRLMMAGDLPGLALRSTLARGAQPGGVRLILEGSQKLVSGSISGDNQLDPALGRWEYTLQLALNSAFGLGEQVYGFVSSGYEVDRLFDHNPRERVIGGGAVLPLTAGQFAINPELTFSRTMPVAAPGVPQTVGSMRRISLRLSKNLARTRTRRAALTFNVEQIDEANRLSDFGTFLSHDRYMAAKLGGGWSWQQESGASLGVRLQLSQGLGKLGARTAQDALASGVGFSRQKAGTDFSKLTIGVNGFWRLSQRYSLAIEARGQTSFGQALLRSEQFALEGSDGLSAYAGGRTALDAGVTARFELAHLVSATSSARALPYVFAAFGAGALEAPTALERRSIGAANLGAGLRLDLRNHLSVNVEYARGLADMPALNSVNRISAGSTLRF